MGSFLFASIALAASIAPWGSCENARDCAKARGLCGRAKAVSQARLAAFEQYVRETAPTVNCRKPSPAELEADALAITACVERQCELRPPAAGLAGAPPAK